MEQLHWRTFHAACAIVAVVIVSCWLQNPPTYFTADDVAIRLALEGRTAPGQPPTGFTLITHSFLGWVIVAAQRLLPGVPWWDVTIATLLLWALSVLFALTWNVLGADWLGRTIAVSSLLMAVVPLVVGLQFTISATLAGGAAAALAGTETGASKRIRSSVLAMSVVLLLAGLLVRPMAAMAGALAVSLCMAPLVLTGRLRIAHLTGIIGTATIMFAAVQYLDGLLYTVSDQWNEYYRYRQIIHSLFEWGGELPAPDVEAIRASVGWSANDWSMLGRWWGVDNVTHGFERLAQAYDARPVVGWHALLRLATSRVTIVGADSLGDLLSASTTIAIVAGIVTATYASRRSALTMVATLMVFCGFCLAIEMIFKALPFRLLGSLAACVVVVTLIAVGAARRVPSPLLRVLGLGAVLVALVPLVPATLTAAADRDRRSEEVEAEVEGLRRLMPSLLVLHADTFPREYWWRPFTMPPMELQAIALGWNNQNPLVQRFLTEAGSCSRPIPAKRPRSLLITYNFA